MDLISTVSRGTSSRPKGTTGPDSRGFYEPIEIRVNSEGRIFLRKQGSDRLDGGFIALWPEEAEELATGLIQALAKARARGDRGESK